MQTLNQHITLLRNYSESHLQINSFGVGDAWELVESFTQTNGVIGEDGTVIPNRTYPVMWVEVNGSNLSGNQLTDNYTIYFADLVNKDERNEAEVLSDMKQLCLDLAAYFKQDEDYESNMNVSLEFTLDDFTEKFNDEVAGWQMSLQITQPYLYNECAIPKLPIDTAGLTNCRPVTIYEDGVLVDTVPSGSSYSYTASSSDVDILINGSAWGTFTSPATEDIPVQNTVGTNLGNKVGLNWEIADITLTQPNGDNETKVAGINLCDTAILNLKQFCLTKVVIQNTIVSLII